MKSKEPKAVVLLVVVVPLAGKRGYGAEKSSKSTPRNRPASHKKLGRVTTPTTSPAGRQVSPGEGAVTPSRRFKRGKQANQRGQTVDAVELSDWAAYYDIDPWDGSRADMRAALVCSTLARVNGADLPPSAFMPDFGPEPEPKTDEQLRDTAFRLNALFGGKVK